MCKAIIKLTAMIILAFALASSASAQRNIGDGAGLAPAGYYTGVESAQGTCDKNSGMCYGNTAVLSSSGEWETYHLSISVDYSVINQFAQNEFTVTGGSWSLVVYRDNAYFGTLYGTVSGGSLLFTTNSAGVAMQETQINLLSSGGLGAFSGKDGQNIPCEYNASTNLLTGEVVGTAGFRF